MDTPRLPRFARLLANDSREIDGPGLLATAIPAEHLASSEWALTLDSQALVLPLELAEPIEHELVLVAPKLDWTLSQIVSLVASGEWEFRMTLDDHTPVVVVAPRQAERLTRRGMLRFYLGCDDRPLDVVAGEFAEIVREEIAAVAQYEIRLIDGAGLPVLLASTERFIYRLDEKRQQGLPVSEDELLAERLIESRLYDVDVDTAGLELAFWVDDARRQRPVILALDGRPCAVLFRPVS